MEGRPATRTAGGAASPNPSDDAGFARGGADDGAAREALVREMRRLAAARRAADAIQRRGKECPIQRPMRDRW